MGEVDGGGELREVLDLAADVVVALLESLETGDGLAAEAERRGDLGPVDLESSASWLYFFWEQDKISSALFILYSFPPKLLSDGPRIARCP